MKRSSLWSKNRSLRLKPRRIISYMSSPGPLFSFLFPQTNALVTAVSIKIRTEHRFENPERESFLLLSFQEPIMNEIIIILLVPRKMRSNSLWNPVCQLYQEDSFFFLVVGSFDFIFSFLIIKA